MVIRCKCGFNIEIGRYGEVSRGIEKSNQELEIIDEVINKVGKNDD
jgi:hypothetical protein